MPEFFFKRKMKSVIFVVDFLLSRQLPRLPQWKLRHFQKYFSYIVAVSFISGGNRGQEKITDLHLANFII